MKINIKSTNIKLSQDVKEFIEKKIDPLEKFIRILNSKESSSPSGTRAIAKLKEANLFSPFAPRGSEGGEEALAEVKKKTKLSSSTELPKEVRVKRRTKLSSPLEAFVEIEKTTHHKKGPFFRAECQLRLPRRTIRSEAVSADLRTALDDVRAGLQRQLKGQKAKMAAKFKRKSRTLKTRLKISPSARYYKKERTLEEGI